MSECIPALKIGSIHIPAEYEEDHNKCPHIMNNDIPCDKEGKKISPSLFIYDNVRVIYRCNLGHAWTVTWNKNKGFMGRQLSPLDYK
jgi:hypothetical protein